VPFYKLPGHRLPTLWTLYRGLLRRLPTPLGHYERTSDIRAGSWDSKQHGFAVRVSFFSLKLLAKVLTRFIRFVDANLNELTTRPKNNLGFLGFTL
jgi:hypothetical protein